MAEITDYVDLTITISDAAPGIPNFGSLLVAGNSDDADAGLFSYAATPTGIAAYRTSEGGDAEDIAYKMLSSVVAQTPHVDRIKFFNTQRALTFDLSITPVGPFTEGKKYPLNVNGTESIVTAGAAASATTISTAMVALVSALPGVTCTDDTGSFTIDTDHAFLYGFDPTKWSVEVLSTSAGDMSDKLDAALAADSDFYGVLIDVDDDTSIADAAAWAEANRKFLFARSKDKDVLTGSGILATLFSAGYHRTALIYSGSDSGRLDASIAGRFLATDPGQSDVQFKNHPGVIVDLLSSAQIDAIKAKNGITYTSTSGVVFTDNGVAVSGRPIAVTRNVDWLEARMQQAILTEFVNSEVIYISSEGITLFEKTIRGVLSEAERKRVILPGWELTVPALADISTSDANNGIIPGFAFSAVTGKAARKVQINGTFI